MEVALAVLVGGLFAAALYLMLSGVLVQFVFGVALASNAVNLLIFTAGRLEQDAPPLISKHSSTLSGPAANALPQALILTAIVISFAMLTFLLVLLYRVYMQTHTLDADDPPLVIETDDEDTMPAAPPSARVLP